MATWMLRGEAPPSPDQVSQARPAPPSAEPPLSPSPAAAPAEPAWQGSELVTIRRVWLRVLVDGDRVLEREVPADTRVPLQAQKTIVIRTGDAGAVRLSLAGEDRGFLGREGEVVTRTFTVPPR
jgi:cytoskeleton protein RodZ